MGKGVFMVEGQQLRRLGKTDLLVSPVGLGVMELAGGGGLIGRMLSFTHKSGHMKRLIIDCIRIR
jgi:aryl-alcohol dehydrogenase-like predicted oxidoreductase